MTIHCRHEANDHCLTIDTPHCQGKNQQSSCDRVITQSNGYTHVIDPYYAPEKHFEPWNLSDLPKNRKTLPRSDKLNKASCTEPSNAPSFSRNYGWDEIEQSEEDTKRLRQLLSIWDAERIAILKLQHDLDKNVLKRTFDYVKRIGQSIGLALWLWVQRPVNCSNISSQYQNQQQQQSLFPVMTVTNSQNSSYPSCTDTLSYHFSENNDNDGSQKVSPSSSPDSLWLKRFVLDEPQEYLPPIARAMKNMLDNDMLVWNSKIQEESAWPHFINQYRMTRNKTFLRNLYENNKHQPSFSQKSSSSSKHTSDKEKLNMEATDADLRNKSKTDRRSPEKKNISQSKDSQSLLKLPKLFSKKDKRKSSKHKQKLKKNDPSKSKDKKIKVDKVRRRSKSKSLASRSLSHSKVRKSTTRSKSKKQKLRNRLKSKRRNSRNRSKSKSRRSPHRSKSKGRKSSRRSKSKKKKKNITARTIR